MPETPDAKLAVLIDADNAQPAGSDALVAEIAKFGVASVKRVYGDWTTPNLRGWKDAANKHAIQPIQQFAYTTGKNATDSAMIIDAMDLLYTDRFDGFVPGLLRQRLHAAGRPDPRVRGPGLRFR